VLSAVFAGLGALLPAVFVAYVATVLVYLVLQATFAQRTRRAHARAAASTLRPSVDVIVPCFNEEPATLAACLASIAAQDYTGAIAVHVVDDGSPNRSELDPVYADFRRRYGYRIVKLPSNLGKRYAQATAITSSRADIVIGVDSDTMLAADGIRQLVAALDDPGVGAVMGEMLVVNASTNWLTRLIDRRYWYACNQVSAAESLFGAVLCCCGPFSGYRRSVLEAVLDDYLNQTFRGRRTTHGEDRHLTNLVLRSGMRTGYAPGARAVTVAPDRMRPFLRQQLRWNRCTYRDMLGIVGQLPSLGAYIVFDAIVGIFAPATLALTLVLVALHIVVGGATGLWWYAGGYGLVALAYCAYGVWCNRDFRSLRLALYGLLHIAVLLPSRVHALFTLTDDRWGQRGASVRPVATRPDGPAPEANAIMNGAIVDGVIMDGAIVDAGQAAPMRVAVPPRLG
jgi:N-acetylglucosaminyltransferase